jgi:CBS domain-containing protein
VGIFLSYMPTFDFLYGWHDKQTSLENFKAHPDILQQPVSVAFEKSVEESEMSVKSTDPLSSILNRLSRDRFHRVLVTSDDMEHIVVSQRDLLRYFQSHNHELGKVLDVSASNITMVALGDRTVQSINFRHTAWDAFTRIADLNPLSAIAVLDDDDGLVAEISAGDLRGLNGRRIPDLSSPIITFLKGTHGDDGILPLICHKRFTLQQVMAALVLGRGHRIWLCNPDDTVEGVVTLTDVLVALNDDAALMQ